jgi:hypothetical protein
MAWSANYLTILTSHSLEWLTAKKQTATKRQLLADISKEIMAYREEHHADEGPLINLDKASLNPSLTTQLYLPDYTESTDLVPEQCEGGEAEWQRFKGHSQRC